MGLEMGPKRLELLRQLKPNAATVAMLSFRKTLALLGGDLCQTAEQYKAWSLNLGHDHVLTTFTSYGDVNSYRQSEIMRSFANADARLAT